MNPYPKTIKDEVSGIEVENQRYLDYQAGVEEVVEFIEDRIIHDPRLGIREEILNIKLSPTYWQEMLREWEIKCQEKMK